MIRVYIQSADTSMNGNRITRLIAIGWICPSCKSVLLHDGEFVKEDSMITDKKHRDFKKRK